MYHCIWTYYSTLYETQFCSQQMFNVGTILLTVSITKQYWCSVCIDPEVNCYGAIPNTHIIQLGVRVKFHSAILLLSIHVPRFPIHKGMCR